MVSSCSHWWHAPVYFTLATVLALTAISSFPPPTPHSTVGDSTIITTNATAMFPAHENFHNASATLRSQGFTIVATLLKLSPEIFFSPSSSSGESTIFALPDSALANCSLPYWAQKLLLQYHTLPSQNLPFRALLRKSSNTCLATAVPTKNIALTKIVPQERLIEINNAKITHPDLFLAGSISIHGVLAPFMTLHSQETEQYSLDFIPSPACTTSPVIFPHWKQIMRTLSSHDFVSFAMGLNFVLEGIIREYSDLNSGTIFAPKELGLVDSPDSLLRQLVRYHIVPERYEFADLASLPEKTRLKTLVSGKDLEITAAFNATQTLAIGGVEVTTPDACSTPAFVVHAISRAFDLDAITSQSIKDRYW
ncbi:hypothetical protein V2J09_010868 [Rumex salicifolius]